MKEYIQPGDNNTITLQRLREIVNDYPARLKAFSEEEFAIKPAPAKWSKKEILGHLIDSASNNHHRFVRSQFEERPFICYDQEKWVISGHYQEMEQLEVINFWEMYNRHLIELISRFSETELSKECRMSDGSTRSVSWLADDYVRHLEHHLRQIFI